MEQNDHHDYGALVGWTSTHVGDRITLRLQSVNKPPPHEHGDVQSQIYLMDRNQAAQLANYLFEMSDHTAPDKRGRGWLSRLFG